jgi:hypothetical protein
MNLTPVHSSSAIAATGYDPESQTLYVQFKSGATYSYAGVPPHVEQNMRKAPSLGRFHAVQIAGQYQAAKVERDGPAKAV